MRQTSQAVVKEIAGDDQERDEHRPGNQRKDQHHHEYANPPRLEQKQGGADVQDQLGEHHDQLKTLGIVSRQTRGGDPDNGVQDRGTQERGGEKYEPHSDIDARLNRLGEGALRVPFTDTAPRRIRTSGRAAGAAVIRAKAGKNP